MKQKLLLIISIVLIITINTNGQNINTGLVGYWTFDEFDGTTVVDSSGNFNDGIAKGDISWIEGKVGNGAMHFDGATGYFTVPPSELLDLTDQLTFAAWINLTSSDGRQQVLQKHHYGFGETNTNGGMFSVLCIDGNWKTYPYSQTAGEWVGEWQHIAFTYNGEEAINYLNGESDIVTPQTGALPVNTDSLGVGSNCPWLDARFNGDLDELRIYNRALSAEEIKLLFAYNPAPNKTSIAKAKNAGLSLYQNMAGSQIVYSLPQQENVTIRIFNINGVELKCLINNTNQPAGNYRLALNSLGFSRGIYICRLETSTAMISTKILLMK